jgi:hypothetical protein
MNKIATGLTSVPMSNVPGSENSEIHFMESEDAEAANSGGFNQMEVGSFAKDLEIIKHKMKMKKKASLRKTSSFFDDKANQQELEDIIEDFNAGADGFDASNDDDYKVNRPSFISSGKFDPSFDPDYWMKKEFRNIAKGADFESGPGDTRQVGNTPEIVRRWWDLYSNGEASADQYETAMQEVFDYTLNLDDDMFTGLSVIANAMLRYKSLKEKYQSSNPSSDTSTTANSTDADNTSASSSTQSAALIHPVGTSLQDVGGRYSYKVISPSEIEITKMDGSTVIVTPDNASQHSVNWDRMIHNLNDQSKTMVKKSANFNFNIAKVSKNMKKELIKLNSALNGLGYKNLIKTADQQEGNVPDRLEQVVEKTIDYAVDVKEGRANPPSNWDDVYYEVIVKLDKEFKDPEFTAEEKTTIQKEYNYTINQAGSSGVAAPKPKGSSGAKGSGKVIARNWAEYAKLGLKQAEIAKLWEASPPSGYDGAYSSYKSWWSKTGGGNPDQVLAKLRENTGATTSAAGATGEDITAVLTNYLIKPLSDTAFPARAEVIGFLSTTNADYIGIYNGKRYTRPSAAAQLLSTPAGITYVKARYDDDLKNDTGGSKALSISMTPTPPESGTTTTSSPTASTGQTSGVANLSTINGQQYYQIPAGKFNLFVRKGKPYDAGGIMMQDTRAGRVSRPQDISNSPRFREYLGSREIRRILDMVEAYEGPEMVPAYKAVLEGNKLDNSGWARLVRSKKREKEITDAANKAKAQGFTTASSTRQSRLDNLRKNGVI